MKEIIIATKNKGKALEFNAFFSVYNIKAISLLDLDASSPDIEETGATFAENAELKARQISDLFNKPVLADDSGLIIDALDGRPGIYSARYAGEPSDDKANIDKVLEEMKDVAAEHRQARFISVLAIAEPGKETFFETGYCEGVITTKEHGENGFGYDPIFIPEGYSVTMAELSAAEKNKISHRKNAISKLDEWIKNEVK